VSTFDLERGLEAGGLEIGQGLKDGVEHDFILLLLRILGADY